MTTREAALIAEQVVKKLKAEGLVEDKIMGTKELADMLGKNERWVYEHSKELPHTMLGREMRFFQSDIYRFLRR